MYIGISHTRARVKCKGEFRAHTVFRNIEYSFRVVVVKGEETSNLLARSVSEKMGLVIHAEEISREIFDSGGLLKTSPVKIELKENAIPYAMTTARRVPFPLMNSVKEELERMVDSGTIREITEPTDWCSPMVPVRKKNGKLRICVDLKKLNVSVKRERYMLPTLVDIAPKLNGAKYFSTLDAYTGFYQIPLDSESQKLTTFITPFGRYCFQRVPFGITSAPEIFQRKMAELLQGIEGVVVIMDDILVFGKTESEHDENLEKVIRRLQEAQLRLNKDKCKFKCTSVDYFGHIVSSDGLKPQLEKVDAIKNLSPPENIHELRRILGLVNYLGKFCPNLSTIAKPMSDLLQSDRAWLWSQDQQSAFDAVKEKICNATALAYYDVTKPIIVTADASSYGLGGALLQKDGNKIIPVAYCSRTLTKAETRYAQIEKETLAAVWTCEKFDRYLVGLDSFTLETDHKPLVPLINKCTIDEAPLRIQRLLMRLMRFNANALHVPGKNLVLADTLSRNPQAHTSNTVDIEKEEEIDCFVDSVVSSWSVSDKKLQKIKDAVDEDEEIKTIIKLTLEGWPKSPKLVPDIAKIYYGEKANLSVHNGLLVCGQRIVIPRSLRKDILERIHEGHPKLKKSKDLAKTTVWWPGINSDMQQKIQNCSYCLTNAPTQHKEPLLPTKLPPRAWSKIGADLCEFKNKTYLITVDYYSRWIEIDLLSTTTCHQVIGKLKNMFSCWGIIDELITDNGPQFSAREFKEFADEYGFTHTTSSPYFAQANGEAERAVQTAKKILNQPKPDIALMNYRATEHSATKCSPAVAMLKREIQTRIPTLPENLKLKTCQGIKKADAKAKCAYKQAYDKRHGTRNLPAIQPDENVCVKLDNEKTWGPPLKVIGKAGDRSYYVAGPHGVIRRNRRHLQVVPPASKVNSPTWYDLPMLKTISVPSTPVQGVPRQLVPAEPPGELETINRQVQNENRYGTRSASGRAIKKPERFRNI